jgi:hypothetical protein
MILEMDQEQSQTHPWLASDWRRTPIKSTTGFNA